MALKIPFDVIRAVSTHKQSQNIACMVIHRSNFTLHIYLDFFYNIKNIELTETLMHSLSYLWTVLKEYLHFLTDTRNITSVLTLLFGFMGIYCQKIFAISHGKYK